MLFFKIGWGGWAFPALADNLAIGCLLAMLSPKLPKIRKSRALLLVIAVVGVRLFSARSASQTLLLLFVLHPIYSCSIAGIILHVVQTQYRALNWAPVAWVGQIS